MTADIDKRFGDLGPSLEDFDNDPTPPPMPSRPADEPRFMGMEPDTWAVMVERKLDAYDTAHRQRHEAQALNFAAFKSEVLEVLARVVEVLKTQERHELLFRDQRTDINSNTRQIGVHDDQIAALKRDVAANTAEIEKQKQAAAKRLRKK